MLLNSVKKFLSDEYINGRRFMHLFKIFQHEFFVKLEFESFIELTLFTVMVVISMHISGTN